MNMVINGFRFCFSFLDGSLYKNTVFILVLIGSLISVRHSLRSILNTPASLLCLKDKSELTRLSP